MNKLVNSMAKPMMTAALVVTAGFGINGTAFAQSESRSATSILLEEIVVTARKRDESSFDVPVAITALSSAQLDVLKVRDIESLAVGLPNVAFDDIGTTPGTANFSIRGLGINSSIPSIDPTVGTFVDGVYMGTNAGIVFDVFDLGSIEVLRGPQGTLFGRNVTGGAVMLNSAMPGEEFEGKVRAAYELGGEDPTSYLMGSVGGAINDQFAAKISVYSSKDDGYFKNLATGDSIGKSDTVSVRPMVVWTPNDTVSLTLIYDYFDTEGDGPAAQNHTNGSGISNGLTGFDRSSFDVSIDEVGLNDVSSDFFRAKLAIETENGTLTNIFGYRDYESTTVSDIDATPISLFHVPASLVSEQTSNELRWSGTLGEKAQLTTGVFFYKNDLAYSEQRRLLGIAAPPGLFALTQDGGGIHVTKTFGLFASVDYALTDQLTLNVGANYTDERKDVNIASLVRNINSQCNVLLNECPFDFKDNAKWDNLSPKIGLTYNHSDNTLMYGHWTQGVRSGGYNLRNTAIDTVNFGPGPFDEETVENLEFGIKTQLESGARISAAIFYNQIDDMQREINLADPIAGVVQVIRNTADTTISGLEFEGLFPINDRLLFNVSLGYIDPSYDNVRFDLNSDGVINDADKNLDLPRAAELTYQVGLTLDSEVGTWGSSTARVSYSYRDESAYTDNNLGFINEQGILDAGVDFYSDDGSWEFGIFGRNLTDEVKHGGDTQLPSLLGPVPLGGTFSPLAKGRTYGVEVTYNF